MAEVDQRALLRELKRGIKSWEREFEQNEGRKPTFQDADEDMMRQYKKYSKLRQALEGAEKNSRQKSGGGRSDAETKEERRKSTARQQLQPDRSVQVVEHVELQSASSVGDGSPFAGVLNEASTTPAKTPRRSSRARPVAGGLVSTGVSPRPMLPGATHSVGSGDLPTGNGGACVSRDGAESAYASEENEAVEIGPRRPRTPPPVYDPVSKVRGDKDVNKGAGRRSTMPSGTKKSSERTARRSSDPYRDDRDGKGGRVERKNREDQFRDRQDSSANESSDDSEDDEPATSPPCEKQAGDDNVEEAVADSHMPQQADENTEATAKMALSEHDGPVPDVPTPDLSIAPLIPDIHGMAGPVNPADLFMRVPRGAVLLCRVHRSASIVERAYPTFYMYNERGSRFLLAARRRKKATLPRYLISSSPSELSKSSPNYVAKLKSNFSGTQFTLFDARRNDGSQSPSRSESPTKSSNIKMSILRRTSSAAKAVQPQLASVSYLKEPLPREMRVGVASVETPDGVPPATEDINNDLKLNNTRAVAVLRSKTPRWNESTHSHCLNFGGRVTVPSIKNFQLVLESGDPEKEGRIVLQFGRTGQEEFSLDVRWPLTPLEGFAIALSSFSAYDVSS